ncbi:hypothetical protein AMTRI_Chr10g230220 [Amborella trichopoda]
MVASLSFSLKFISNLKFSSKSPSAPPPFFSVDLNPRSRPSNSTVSPSTRVQNLCFCPLCQSGPQSTRFASSEHWSGGSCNPNVAFISNFIHFIHLNYIHFPLSFFHILRTFISNLSRQDLLLFIAILGSTPKHNVKPRKYHNHAYDAAKPKPLLV